MRDVSAKYSTLRTARASATLAVSPATIRAIRAGTVPKADPLGVAKIAAIQAAKQTSVLIPYCHQVPLDFVGVEIDLGRSAIAVTTQVKAIWKTGVEMEALAAASAAALTLYDMLKPIDESMEITHVTLLEKTGGKSELRRPAPGLTAAVIVISDTVSAGKGEDRSGRLLRERLAALGLRVGPVRVVPDDRALIERALVDLADRKKTDLIVTTGGTGAGPRDVTPEATAAVIDRRLPGVEEAFRGYGQDRLPTAMLSRGVAGLRGDALILNLPGAPRAAADGIHALFPSILHVFRMIRGEGHGPRPAARSRRRGR
jgi:molybdenum cofactor biosynthesis protein MoaC